MKVSDARLKEVCDEITINGVVYVKKGSTQSDHVICATNGGWIFEGQRQDIDIGTLLYDASNVRSWQNGRGIGGLAKLEYKDEYTLDQVGIVHISPENLLYTILITEW
jgi:hypothetical protein